MGYWTKYLLLRVFTMVLLLQTKVDAQAPLISYGGQKLLTKDSSFIPFAAKNKGGIIPAERYGSTNSFAGNDQIGMKEGIGIAASFQHPSKIAIDKKGNLYVSDEGNNCIRKISPDALVSLFAGSGIEGKENNSNGRMASFHGPAGIVIDMYGNLFVADTYNHQIRKISATGSVSTYAGNGHAGFADANNAMAASFSFPVDLTIDKSGNLFVVDEGNHAIRKISPAGNVSTIAGTGMAGSQDHLNGKKASFNQPNGIVMDQHENLFVVDQLNHKIRKINKEGVVNTFVGSGLAGSSDNQLGMLARFNHPRGIAIDQEGNLFVADAANQKIRKITTSGEVSSIAGSGVPGFLDNESGSLAGFYFPNGLAMDSTGKLFVTDYLNNRIRKIETNGYSIVPELLPAGIQFDYHTGVFSGKPTEININKQYTIAAYNKEGRSTDNLSLTVVSEPGNALSFDGFDDRVIIPDAEGFKTPVVTAEAWVNIRSHVAGFARIILKRNNQYMYDDSYSIGIDSLNRFTAAICSGNGKYEGQKFAFQQDTFTLGKWYFIAAVFRSDSMKLFVNGKLEQSVKTGFPLSHGKNALVLGFDERMNFSMDEMRIFNTDRSGEIENDQYNVIPITTPGLVAYYNFNSGMAGEENGLQTTLVDISGNGYNGTLVNFQPLSGKESNWVESFAMMLPKGLEATEVRQGAFTANFSKPILGEVDEYLFDLSENPQFSSFVSGYRSMPVSAQTISVVGLNSGKTYYYRVSAEKKSVTRQGRYSNTVKVAIP